MNPTLQKYNHGLNLLLADQMARVYGESRAKAIKHCANVVRSETKDVAMYALADSIVKASNGKAVETVLSLGDDMKKEGLLPSSAASEWPPETRIDIIGQNGNDGTHYSDQ